jgi:hypothetical protein
VIKDGGNGSGSGSRRKTRRKEKKRKEKMMTDRSSSRRCCKLGNHYTYHGKSNCIALTGSIGLHMCSIA